MEHEDSLLIISSLAGVLGIKEVWSIIKKRMDLKHSANSEKASYKKNRIIELEEEIKTYNEIILQLTIRVAKLEERILHIAKDRVKTKEIDNEK
jgi:hypothetical protein